MKSSHIAFDLNGSPAEMLVRPGASLLSALRDTLGYTATRKGCEQGSCGACTVMVNGRAVLACIIPVETLGGATVETAEGLARDGALHRLQQAFLDGFATQCGFCTSGMLMAIKALLRDNPDPGRGDVIAAISGNVCRCTGYVAIVDAALDAAKPGAAPDSKAA